MWIFTTKGFYSIVAVDRLSQFLLVRARFQGDIEKLFPGSRVTKTPDRDYLYRTIVPADVVAKVLADEIEKIDYPNFKDAVADASRCNAYTDVWATMCYAGDHAEIKAANPFPVNSNAVLRADALLGKPPTAKPLSRMRRQRFSQTKIRRKHDTRRR